VQARGPARREKGGRKDHDVIGVYISRETERVLRCTQAWDGPSPGEAGGKDDVADAEARR